MSTLQKKITTLRNELMSAFPERTPVIDGSLAAVLAGEHILTIGAPGSGKSLIARTVAQSFGGIYFERLMTKFSTPEELFGPISLKALEQDRFVRTTAGKLPEANFGFIDEVFKANSAILNSLLTIMNERLFHNDGAAPMQVPLVSLFGASNELPEGKELEALFDRFLLRFDVNYLLRPANLKAVLVGGEPTVTTSLTMQDLSTAQAEVAKVKLSDHCLDALLAIRDALKVEGIIASDRRWKKSLKLAQASAWVAGEKMTSPEDLTILTDSLWREPKERPKVAKVVGRISDPASMQALEILDAARETADKVAALRGSDRKAYIAKCAEGLEQFNQQNQKLEKLALSGGRRARATVADACAEIQAMHAEMARAVSAGLGLRRAAGA